MATKPALPYSPKPNDAALQVEYYHLQKTIEDFDARAITIKAWSVSFGLASLVGAFASKSHLVFLLAATGAALFWLLEAFWKSFQLGYFLRVKQLEVTFVPRRRCHFRTRFQVHGRNGGRVNPGGFSARQHSGFTWHCRTHSWSWAASGPTFLSLFRPPQSDA